MNTEILKVVKYVCLRSVAAVALQDEHSNKYDAEELQIERCK
jgi:hypothetical protein